jgi:hypothetical protein
MAQKPSRVSYRRLQRVVERSGATPAFNATLQSRSIFGRAASRPKDRVSEKPNVAYDGRLRLCANGLAFSRRLIRTGVPGNSKNSRKELTR